MRNGLICVLLFLFSPMVFAISAFQQYQIQFNKDPLVAKSGDKEVKGELEKKAGDFAQWQFNITDETGFEIIVNQKTHKILSRTNLAEAGGPFLKVASPDSRYVVFDYGTAPAPRKFEVRNSEGKVVFKNTYFDEMKWTEAGLQYNYPTALPLDFNAETKACRDLGAAWQVQMYVFDGKQTKKLATPARIACSN